MVWLYVIISNIWIDYLINFILKLFWFAYENIFYFIFIENISNQTKVPSAFILQVLEADRVETSFVRYISYSYTVTGCINLLLNLVYI